ncbi:MAG: hypothetical protein EHM21_00630 [Chloroflexi bacterium]|nr:MAG: hypothetical protein EHM21_00630 [Chloroflexota bacterium]
MRAKSLQGYLSVLTRFFHRRNIDEDSKLRYLDVRESLEVESDQPMPVQADGEVIGKTPVRVKMVPKALRVIVPMKEIKK